MKITILTAGTRGDTQPYLALGLGLKAKGHQVKMVAFENYKDFICRYGIEFFPITVNIKEIIQSEIGIQITKKRNNPLIGYSILLNFFKSIIPKIANAFLNAVYDADLIINTFPLIGYEIAKTLEKPYINATIFPGYSSYLPNPFFQLELPSTKLLNTFSHLFVDTTTSLSIRQELSDWHRKVLGIKSGNILSLTRWQKNIVPTLYGFSEKIINRPVDWGEEKQITGFWFLNEESYWHPQNNLLDFISSGTPPIYVGFGSMPVNNKEKIADTILELSRKTTHRIILSEGWGLENLKHQEKIFTVKDVPHDWLFPRTSLVICHGGAGTIATSLKSGTPFLSIPFFADQPFWSNHLHKINLGMRPLNMLHFSADLLLKSINIAINDTNLKKRIEEVSLFLSKEDGVKSAITWIEKWHPR